jgi:Protein of unknown function (DUF2726).
MKNKGCLFSIFNKQIKKQENPIYTNYNYNYYYSKKRLLTPYELYFYKVFDKAFGQYFKIIPQINLAAIIKKEGNYKYENELFRNIDFGILDKDFNIKLLIELNDSTHNEPRRQYRDIKIKDICQKAEIKLITFYTDKPNKEEYIINRVSEYL